MNTAVNTTASREPSAAGQYLSFSLDGEDYGIDILKVREIRGWESVREIPETPDYVKGVLNLRGVIVPIIDMRKRFNMAQIDYTPTTVIIVLSVNSDLGGHTMGMVVDSVSDVLDVEAKRIRPSPQLGSRINTKFIQGLVSMNDQMVVLLNSDNLLDPEQFSNLEAVAQGI